MKDTENLKQLFPGPGEIPLEHRLASPIHQRTYLVGGEFKTWDGECKTVLSPICERRPDGTVQQIEIGSYPVMGEAQSDAALDAAVAAYDNGRGEWPTMSVTGRIACMQDFVRQMAAQRQTIVSLIMGDRQEPGRFAKGVRPHGRVHRRHHRGDQDAG